MFSAGDTAWASKLFSPQCMGKYSMAQKTLDYPEPQGKGGKTASCLSCCSWAFFHPFQKAWLEMDAKIQRKILGFWGTWFRGDYHGSGFPAGLNDLGSLFQPWWSCDSVISYLKPVFSGVLLRGTGSLSHGWWMSGNFTREQNCLKWNLFCSRWVGIYSNFLTWSYSNLQKPV